MLLLVDDLTYREVANVLGIPVGTVLSRLSRARQRVRTQLRTNSPSTEDTMMLTSLWTCHRARRRLQRYLDADPSGH